MAHDYKIIDRGEDVPRGKRFTFTIDGRETAYYSPLHRGIERVIERIKKGMLNPGGVPLAKVGVSGGPAEKLDNRQRKVVREGEAVEAFLTRGRLGQKQSEATA